MVGTSCQGEQMFGVKGEVPGTGRHLLKCVGMLNWNCDHYNQVFTRIAGKVFSGYLAEPEILVPR